MLAATYTALTSEFAVTAASITTTSAIYLSSICILYLELARQKWWAYLRLDAICGATLLLVLSVVWWARNLSDASSGNGDGTSLYWLLVIIDIALCLVAAGVVSTAVYVAPKLRKRGVRNVGDPRQLLKSVPSWDADRSRSSQHSCYRHPFSGSCAAHSSWQSTSRLSSPTGIKTHSRRRCSFIPS